MNKLLNILVAIIAPRLQMQVPALVAAPLSAARHKATLAASERGAETVPTIAILTIRGRAVVTNRGDVYLNDRLLCGQPAREAELSFATMLAANKMI